MLLLAHLRAQPHPMYVYYLNLLINVFHLNNTIISSEMRCMYSGGIKKHCNEKKYTRVFYALGEDTLSAMTRA